MNWSSKRLERGHQPDLLFVAELGELLEPARGSEHPNAVRPHGEDLLGGRRTVEQVAEVLVRDNPRTMSAFASPRSASTRSTRHPARAARTPRLAATWVLPTPPLPLVTEMTRKGPRGFSIFWRRLWA